MFSWPPAGSTSGPPSAAVAANRTTASGTTSLASTGRETCRSRRRCRAEHALDVRLHGLQLATPVTPAVRAVGREVEHPVAAPGPRVGRLEILVGADRQALQELRRNLRVPPSAIQICRVAVAAVHPDPGAVRHQATDLPHGVVALPGGPAVGTPQVHPVEAT